LRNTDSLISRAAITSIIQYSIAKPCIMMKRYSIIIFLLLFSYGLNAQLDSLHIPQTIVDKIFQPFFTTKPTGEGAGLGLSLSYDIVKAHGGEIKVETNEGKGTRFAIRLKSNES
jgi:hypothetical protein